MNRRNLLLLLAALPLLPLDAHAHEFKVGDLEIGHPWSRATGQSRPGVGYMRIRNHGQQPDRLLGAETRIADRAEIHTHQMENDVAKMVRVDGVDIPAAGEVEFKPKGFHLMFMGLKQPLTEGDSFPVTLIFEHAGRIDVTFVTAAAGATGPEDH